MIKVNSIPIKSTVFPDGTSQVWKLPSGLFEGDFIDIVWNFESERELMDLFSLRALIPEGKEVSLHVPYLPYARQDKPVTNDTTFNLQVFAALLNGMNFSRVSAVDVHNPELTKTVIKNFVNLGVKNILEILATNIKPAFLVFPDKGAADRYARALAHIHVPHLTFTKTRDSLTGRIYGHSVYPPILASQAVYKYLVIDDLCDGGATFISVANMIKDVVPNADLHLFTTHGIYSKGKEPLINAGFKLYTTNSLIKNVEGFRV
jgi:ribose-phosphate pyrophosphokinase